MLKVKRKFTSLGMFCLSHRKQHYGTETDLRGRMITKPLILGLAKIDVYVGLIVRRKFTSLSHRKQHYGTETDLRGGMCVM